ncbi:alpha/beta hydrolase [Cohnella suwonensis]|uniref:Alpha/beta hydrolase n=1 Tax=Cohnella suwonensis TaxID=696072 RepID=A0ABW0M0J1_9BACL
MQRELSGTMMWLTGWSMPASTFDRLRDQLPDFRHVSVNYSRVESADEMLEMTESAATALSSSRDGPLFIMGWSLGGVLALRLAALKLADGLALFSTTAKFTRPVDEADRGWADAYVRRMIHGIRKERHAVEEKFRRLAFGETEWRVGYGDEFPIAGSWSDSALIAGLEVLRGVECLTRLRGIECPVLLVHGKEDRICPYAAAVELFTGLPRAKLLTLPGSGHAPFLGREADLAESLRSWWHDR